MLRIAFMGSPQFAVPALRALIDKHQVSVVITQSDKTAGRGKRLVSPPVKLVANEAGIPVLQPKSAKKPEFFAELANYPADIGVVVAYGKILPLAVLEAFPHGCINIHGSLLPAYRGAAPIQWALIKGEAETGITIMQLDEGMDTGPMISKRAIAITASDTSASVFEKLAPLGAEMLIEALAEIEAGTVTRTAQDDALATYAPMLKKPDGLIDWQRPAAEVANLIRGVDPWPGAVTTLAGASLKVFAATLAEGDGGPPGTIMAVDESGLKVACGQGVCAIAEVQAAGKKRMTARAFAAGRALAVGSVLGD
jgi:methionyl-tRNA formyltransferase